jgi:hypothetical protein
MGLISRHVRKGRNQDFAAPITFATALSPAEVAARLGHICAQLNANFDAWASGASTAKKIVTGKGIGSPNLFYYHTWLSSTGDQGLIGFAKPPKEIAAISSGRRPGGEWWLAAYLYHSEPTGGGVVELKLLRWVTGDDGKIKNRDRYVQLRDELEASLTVR